MPDPEPVKLSVNARSSFEDDAVDIEYLLQGAYSDEEVDILCITLTLLGGCTLLWQLVAGVSQILQRQAEDA